MARLGYATRKALRNPFYARARRRGITLTQRRSSPPEPLCALCTTPIAERRLNSSSWRESTLSKLAQYQSQLLSAWRTRYLGLWRRTRDQLMVISSFATLAQAAGRSLPRLRKAPVSLSDAAAERIKKLLEQRQKVSPATS